VLGGSVLLVPIAVLFPPASLGSDALLEALNRLFQGMQG
jgi:hypothetical protein